MATTTRGNCGRPHSGRPPKWDVPVPLSVLAELGEDMMAHLDLIDENGHDELMVRLLVKRCKRYLVDQGTELGVPYVDREPAA